MDPKRLEQAWESARRGRLLDGLTSDEVWEFAWELVNEHNQLAARCGAHDARRAMKHEMAALARVGVPIPGAARDLVQGAILAAYRAEFERSQQDGYVAQNFDDLDYHAYEEAEIGG